MIHSMWPVELDWRCVDFQQQLGLVATYNWARICLEKGCMHNVYNMLSCELLMLNLSLLQFQFITVPVQYMALLMLTK